MHLYELDGLIPHVDPSAWIAPGVHIIGNVRIDARASIWFGSVLRADNERIHIGEGSCVQDNCTIHADTGLPVCIEPNVSIAHQVMLHSCHIGEGSLVGMRAVILNNAHIGKNCLVGAGSLVTEGKTFPDGMLIMGSPARAIRKLNSEDMKRIQLGTVLYQKNTLRYANGLKAIAHPTDAAHQ